MATLELSNEDALRLNVLVNNVEAIRIDERTLTVYGLSARGEAKVQLNPTGRGESYLKAVREFLSASALGSPSGYPVHLNRWTRMGQARDTNLAKLLMLGEAEAITAVVCAPGLTEELARRAWWSEPTSENARRMLARECVARSELGKTLAGHLIEHLPFESEAQVIIDSVRLILQPGLVTPAVRSRLWDKGASQSAYRIGFLAAEPDALPQPLTARSDFDALRPVLIELGSRGNPYARLLLRSLDGPGQTFLATSDQVLRKLSSQDATVSMLNVLSAYFSQVRTDSQPVQDGAILLLEATRAIQESLEAQDLLAKLPVQAELQAMHALARMDEALVTPVFARSSATGALMRRKIAPMIEAVLAQIAILRRVPHG